MHVVHRRTHGRQGTPIHVRALVLLSLVGALMAAENVSVVVYAQQPAAAAPALVFSGVTVVDVDQGKLVPNQRVVIEGNRIWTMGPAAKVRIPPGARVVEARDKYLIPGLWDLHTHGQRLTDVFHPLFLANGVTGIREAGDVDVPLAHLIQRRRDILAGTQVGPPRQILSGLWLISSQGGFATPADVHRRVDAVKAAGADMLKMYTLSKEAYFAIAAEARRAGIPFGGHVTHVSALDASDSGALIIDHAPGIDSLHCVDKAASVAGCQSETERFRRNGTWWVPTLTVALFNLVHFGGGPASGLPASRLVYERLHAFSREFWQADTVLHGNWLRSALRDGIAHSAASPGYLAIMQQTRFPILAGTDVGPDQGAVRQDEPPGFSLHAELAMYVAEGLTPLAALQSATLNPAKMLRATDSLGTVAPGKLADLVLLDADPLADITNTTTIRAVVANGRYFDRAALDQLLTEVKAKVKKP